LSFAIRFEADSLAQLLHHFLKRCLNCCPLLLVDLKLRVDGLLQLLQLGCLRLRQRLLLEIRKLRFGGLQLRCLLLLD
jgi:hypothetical protein